MTRGDAKQLTSILFDLVPEDGTPIGNVSLLERFRKVAKRKLSVYISEEGYWEIRNELIARGLLEKGRGRGGSVYRVSRVEPRKERGHPKRIAEADLYSMVSQFVERTWVKDNGISTFVLEKTAAQGKRNTGGKWTRPDLALVSVKSFPYIPGKILEIVTFEVKPENDCRIEGVFETAAHSRFSHKSYLMIYLPRGDPQTKEFERVERECERFGLGLIIFTDPKEWDSYETIQEAERRNPDPADVSRFIATQVSKSAQERVLEMVK